MNNVHSRDAGYKAGFSFFVLTMTSAVWDECVNCDNRIEVNDLLAKVGFASRWYQ